VGFEWWRGVDRVSLAGFWRNLFLGVENDWRGRSGCTRDPPHGEYAVVNGHPVRGWGQGSRFVVAKNGRASRNDSQKGKGKGKRKDKRRSRSLRDDNQKAKAKAGATATATANTGVLHCVQDDGEKQTTTTTTATAKATAKAKASDAVGLAEEDA